jgi:hypothetical protein
MRRNFTKGLMVGAMTLAGLGTAGMVKTLANTDNNAVTVSNSKATEPRKEKKGAIKVNPMTGGLDMDPYRQLDAMRLMSPKEYGMRFGNGGSKRSNRNRYSHNAKLKRRMA